MNFFSISIYKWNKLAVINIIILTTYILDTESDEWMYCNHNDLRFFLSSTFEVGSKYALIFEIRIFSVRKVNVVGV